MLAERFHYIKMKFSCLWDQLNGYYAMLDDSEGIVEHKEQSITQAKVIITKRQRGGCYETRTEEVAKRVNADTVLQQQTLLAQELRDKLKAFI